MIKSISKISRVCTTLRSFRIIGFQSGLAVCCFLAALVAAPVQAQPICTGNCEVIDGDIVLVATDRNGDGSLTIQNGDIVFAPNGALVGLEGSGQFPGPGPDIGTLLITGQGSRLDIGGQGSFGDFRIGNAATGNVTIADGAIITTTGDPATGLTGLVLIGTGGTSTFDINSGGTLQVQSPTSSTGGSFAGLDIGKSNGDYAFPANGLVNIDGAGSAINVSADEVFVEVGVDDIGQSSRGTVNIANGGELTLTSVAAAGTANAAVLSVGHNGEGIINVNSGGSLRIDNQAGNSFLLIGSGNRVQSSNDGSGIVNLSGPQSSVVIDGLAARLDVGSSDPTSGSGANSTGVLDVTDGAKLRLNSDTGDTNFYLAGGELSQGTVRIDGAGSALNVSGGNSVVLNLGGDFTAGIETSNQVGRLQITNGGLLEAIGPDIETENFAAIGNGFGSAEVIVNSGGIFRTNGLVRVGYDIGADSKPTGLLIVNDTGLVDAGRVAVGSVNPDFLESAGTDGSRGAFLLGTGTVRVSSSVDLLERGQISPGADFGQIGTLRIDGNFTSQTGGILEIDALEDGTGDSLSITGTANLSGGSVRSLSPDGEWSVARQYTILSADGGLVGTFDDVTSNLEYLIPSLTYTENNVLLNLSRLGAPVQEELLEESNAQQVSVTSRAVSTAIQSQVSSTIAAAFGSAVSPTVAYAPGAVSTGLSAGDDASSGNIWLNFTPSSYKSDSILPGSNSSQKIDGDSWNLLIGADQLLAERYVVGAFVGAESADIDIARIKGKQENDGFMVGAYTGVAINDMFYASVNGNYSWLENSVEERAFDAPEAVKGDFDSGRYSVGVDLNAVKMINNFDLRGQLGYNYTHEDYDSYNTSLGDRAQPEDQKLGRARLAVETSYVGERYRPYLSLAYENDVVTSIDLDDEDGFVAYAGIRSVALKEGLTVEAFLSAVFDRDDQDHNMLGLNLHYAW